MNNLDVFSNYGGFSGTSNYPSSDEIDTKTFLNGVFDDAALVNDRVDVCGLAWVRKSPGHSRPLWALFEYVR